MMKMDSIFQATLLLAVIYTVNAVPPGDSRGLLPPACDEPDLEGAVSLFVNTALAHPQLYLLDPETLEILTRMGMDPRTPEGIHAITCIINGIESLQDISDVTSISIEELPMMYESVVSVIRPLDTDTVRQLILAVIRLFSWVADSGLPEFPLAISPVETWKRFYEIRNMPFWVTIRDIEVIWSTVEMLFGNIASSTPEELTRIAHTVQSTEEFASRMGMMGFDALLDTPDFMEEVQTYLEMYVTGFILAEELIDRGWLELPVTSPSSARLRQ